MTHETEIPPIQPPEKVREFRKTFRRGWTMRGVVLLLVGVAGVMMPFFSSFATVMTLAVMLGMAGISYAVSVFQSGTTKERLWDLLGAVVFLVAAFALFSRPLQGMAYVTLAVGVAFIAEGIVRGFWSATRRPEGWGWLVASAVASVILGGLILGQWPESGMYAVGTLMGLNFIFAAVACFVVASAMPKADAPMFDKVSDMASDFVEGARRKAEDLGDAMSPQTHPPAPPRRDTRTERSMDKRPSEDVRTPDIDMGIHDVSKPDLDVPFQRNVDKPRGGSLTDKPKNPGVSRSEPHKPPPPPTLDDDDDFDE